MANRSNLSRLFNYVKNYGKPDESKPFSLSGLMLSTFIILSLSVLAFRFHVGFLCVLLIGEYKENIEYWRYQFKRTC